MKNKNMPMLALGLLAVSALGGTAYQVSAQSISNQNTPTVVQKVANIDAEQNSATENNSETNDSKDVVSPSVLAQVKITESQARQIALTANPATTINTIVIGDENGKAIYEVKLSNNIEVTVDAVTGTVVKSENDDEQSDNQVDQKDSHGDDVETNDGADQND
jgi:uncharacterized membrane protein YkoI